MFQEIQPVDLKNELDLVSRAEPIHPDIFDPETDAVAGFHGEDHRFPGFMIRTSIADLFRAGQLVDIRVHTATWIARDEVPRTGPFNRSKHR